jgi:hypothetical protein
VTIGAGCGAGAGGGAASGAAGGAASGAGFAAGSGIGTAAGATGGAPSGATGGPKIIMLGLGGSAEPAALPVSVSGIGSVRTGIRLRCCASAALMASTSASAATPAAHRVMSTGLAIEESTIPPEQSWPRPDQLPPPSPWWAYSNQVG